MNKHLYLSMIPEALIASMLTPTEFGVYYAVGSMKKARGQAIFFEVDPDFRHPKLPIEEGLRRCVPHEDGSPKRSVYISVYRALERIPLDAIRKCYFVTRDGRVLGLDASDAIPASTGSLHLYQEVAPVHPLVVSTLGPRAFYDLIVKKPESLVKLPAICFVELQLGALAEDPEFGSVGNLPYADIDHLRECLLEVENKLVTSKMVDRISPAGFPYRMMKSGLFVGNKESLLYFPLPSQDELRTDNYRWWRSADM